MAVILSVSSSSVQLKAVKGEDEEEEAERGKANIVFSLEMEREEGGGWVLAATSAPPAGSACIRY